MISAEPTLRSAFRPFGRRFALAALYFIVVFGLGTTGYMWIESWSLLDGLYMAVTTVTSVGFMEVHPLSRAGRLFTLALILLGVTGLGIWWGLITALIVELDLGGLLRRRRVMHQIDHLSDHFIVCGAGRMGRVVVAEMSRAGAQFVLIERDPDRIAAVQENYPEVLLIEADATRSNTLRAAGIERARGLAACLTADGDNLLLSITARGMRQDLTIVARAYDEETLDKLRRAGADHPISPNITGGIRMASTLVRPSIVSFLDVTSPGTDIALRLEETELPSNSPLVGQSLAEAKIPQTTGLIVLALRLAADPASFLYNPGPETRLGAGDVMIALGQPDQIAKLRQYVAGKNEK